MHLHIFFLGKGIRHTMDFINLFSVPFLNHTELELVKLNLIFQKDIKMQIPTNVLTFLIG